MARRRKARLNAQQKRLGREIEKAYIAHGYSRRISKKAAQTTIGKLGDDNKKSNSKRGKASRKSAKKSRSSMRVGRRSGRRAGRRSTRRSRR